MVKMGVLIWREQRVRFSHLSSDRDLMTAGILARGVAVDASAGGRAQGVVEVHPASLLIVAVVIHRSAIDLPDGD